jgi:hypothetical protein
MPTLKRADRDAQQVRKLRLRQVRGLSYLRSCADDDLALSSIHILDGLQDIGANVSPRFGRGNFGGTELFRF